jgi:hypothetical protein
MKVGNIKFRKLDNGDIEVQKLWHGHDSGIESTQHIPKSLWLEVKKAMGEDVIEKAAEAVAVQEKIIEQAKPRGRKADKGE